MISTLTEIMYMKSSKQIYSYLQGKTFLDACISLVSPDLLRHQALSLRFLSIRSKAAICGIGSSKPWGGLSTMMFSSYNVNITRSLNWFVQALQSINSVDEAVGITGVLLLNSNPFTAHQRSPSKAKGPENPVHKVGWPTWQAVILHLPTSWDVSWKQPVCVQ